MIRILVVCLALVGCAHSQPPAESAPRASGPSDLFAQGMSAVHAGDWIRAVQYLDLAQRAGHPSAAVMPPLLTACVASGRYRAALAFAEAHLSTHDADSQLSALVVHLREAIRLPPVRFNAPPASVRPMGL